MQQPSHMHWRITVDTEVQQYKSNPLPRQEGEGFSCPSYRAVFSPQTRNPLHDCAVTEIPCGILICVLRLPQFAAQH